MYEARAHLKENYLFAAVKGRMELAEAQEMAAALLVEARKLKSGFSIVNDLTETRASAEEVAQVIRRTQAEFFKLGCTRVIRVVAEGAASASLQFSRVQREAGAPYDVVIVRTLAEALTFVRKP